MLAKESLRPTGLCEIGQIYLIVIFRDLLNPTHPSLDQFTAFRLLSSFGYSEVSVLTQFQQ